MFSRSTAAWKSALGSRGVCSRYLTPESVKGILTSHAGKGNNSYLTDQPNCLSFFLLIICHPSIQDLLSTYVPEEKAMAPHSSALTWRTPWMEEPCGLQSTRSLGVGHDWVTSLSLEKEMATHSSVLAWRIPGTGEPGGQPSMGLHRVGHDWSNLAAAVGFHLYTHTELLAPKTDSSNSFSSVSLIFVTRRQK